MAVQELGHVVLYVRNIASERDRAKIRGLTAMKLYRF